jgi:acyl-coenzyme A thioesterase 9
MPALADHNTILIRDTKLENAIICQPQQRNMHGRIFGGFLMRRAYELAFSTCYVFGGMRPLFLEVDHVDFRKPVRNLPCLSPLEVGENLSTFCYASCREW